MVRKAVMLALVVIVVSVAMAIAVFAIPYLLDLTERGATLTITLVNGTDTVHVVYITTRYAQNGTRVGFNVAAVQPGDMATVKLSLDRKVNGEPLEVEFEDRTVGESSTQTWTPTEGASGTMDYTCPTG